MTVTCPDGTTLDHSSRYNHHACAVKVPESASTLGSCTSDSFADLFFERF
jgi:hypothetical protein